MFGINFFPSFRPEDGRTADYYDQCLRIGERADALGYSSIKTVEHSFLTTEAIPPIRACFCPRWRHERSASASSPAPRSRRSKGRPRVEINRDGESSSRVRR
jgi:hypothetical protein